MQNETSSNDKKYEWNRHNNCSQTISFLNFGGTDLNSEILSYIIVTETSPPIGRALSILRVSYYLSLKFDIFGETLVLG